MILINLLPPEMRRKEAPKIVMPELPVKKTILGLAAGILALQLLLSIVAVFYSMRHKIAQHETAKLSSKMGEVRQAKAKMTAIGKKMQDIRSLTEKRFYWALVLNEISMTATRGIWLRTLSLDEINVAKAAEEEPAADKKGKKRLGKKTVEEKEAPKKEDKKKAKKEKKKAAPAAAPVKKITMENVRIMKLEGSCAGGTGQETALIGKYLKGLRDSAYFKEIFSDIDLSGMNQRRMGETEVFDFVILCRFKKDKL